MPLVLIASLLRPIAIQVYVYINCKMPWMYNEKGKIHYSAMRKRKACLGYNRLHVVKRDRLS